MKSDRNLKRTELFLVRVWLSSAGGGKPHPGASADRWKGRVQRVVDGEAHEFDDWQGLTDALAAMLPGNTPPHPPPEDKA